MLEVMIKNVFGLDNWYGYVAELIRLENEYHTSLDSPDPDIFSPQLYDWEKDYTLMSEKSDAFCCFVAFDGKKPIGFASALVESSEVFSCKSGYVADVFVVEPYRNKGIASLLMMSVMRWFAGFPEVRSITLEVWKGNEAAMKLYEKHGFAVRDYTMSAFNNPD